MQIIFNGEIVQVGKLPDLHSLLHGNYVYACVNTVGHRPLYLGKHLEYAADTYQKLYGIKPETDVYALGNGITEMLGANRMPMLGNIVNIYFIPPSPGTGYAAPDVMVVWERSTIYKGYELISIRPRVILTNYEIPFSGHRTSVSLTAARYMQAFASRSGAHLALRVNRAERVLSCGEYPVFFVKDGTVYTPPAPDDAPMCLERELMLQACTMAGIEVMQRSIASAEISGADEIIVFDHTGLQSVLCWGSYYYYNLAALRLEKQLAAITSAGL